METAGTTYRDAMFFFSIMIYIQVLSNDWVNNLKVNVTLALFDPNETNCEFACLTSAGLSKSFK